MNIIYWTDEHFQLANEIPNSFSRFGGNWLPSVFTSRMNNIAPLTEGLEKHQITSSNSFKEFSIRCTSGIDTDSSLKSPLPSSTMFLYQSPLSMEHRNNKQNIWPNSVSEPGAKQSLGFSVLPTSSTVAEEKNPSYKEERKSREVVLKQLKSGVSIRSKSNKGMAWGSDNRVGRPPGEGRSCCHLLRRYLPKMTDQELLQIHGEYPLL